MWGGYNELGRRGEWVYIALVTAVEMEYEIYCNYNAILENDRNKVLIPEG